MKKSLIVILVILVILLASIGKGVKMYNGFISLEEGVDAQWAQVENVYQRRMDLIPNLVNTVKGYAAHESETLTAVVEARAKATQTNVSGDNMAQFQQAQSGLTGALSKLLVSVERYPELKANQNFLELQSQLEGTENRINVARDRFNEGVNNYNKHIKVFPNSVLAGMFNFDEMDRYSSDTGSEKAPDASFDFNKKKE